MTKEEEIRDIKFLWGTWSFGCWDNPPSVCFYQAHIYVEKLCKVLGVNEEKIAKKLDKYIQPYLKRRLNGDITIRKIFVDDFVRKEFGI